MGVPPVTGKRWQVVTDRANEADRHGIGEDTLHETLKHLRARGDTSCSYLLGNFADTGFVRIDLQTYVGFGAS